ncbi:MAG: undecaprenyl-diphosphatase UppP [Chloroflexi bacterium HGW-Chloroflexi-1]|nr:MAG: undecaprenyl-diphosphatase UppP [Chloroflexi bacterium HGW-Chloroflexi-1]
MNIFQAFVLGLLQGLTEFIPVSSSGHLVLAPWALHWPAPGLAFDTLAHWGTLTAVIIYFWRDWLRVIDGFIRSLTTRGLWRTGAGGRLADHQSQLAWWLIIGSIPAAVLGYAFKDFFEGLFSHPTAVSGFLLITAAILALSERLGRRMRDMEGLRLADAVLIGLAQAAAIAPGISRSGATIAAGLGRGLTREAAARFSFMLATPAIFGAGLLQLVDLVQAGNLGRQLPILLTGFLTAAVAGYLCIKFLLAYLRNGKLYVFAAYCAVVGAVTLIASVVI